MTNAERLALARNKLARLETARRLAWEAGEEQAVRDTDAQIAKLSLVGAGMKTSPGVAARMFRVLADHGVNIEMISTSTIRISVVVERSMLDTAIVALHSAFGLDADSDYSAPLPERT